MGIVGSLIISKKSVINLHLKRLNLAGPQADEAKEVLRVHAPLPVLSSVLKNELKNYTEEFLLILCFLHLPSISTEN